MQDAGCGMKMFRLEGLGFRVDAGCRVWYEDVEA